MPLAAAVPFLAGPWDSLSTRIAGVGLTVVGGGSVFLLMIAARPATVAVRPEGVEVRGVLGRARLIGWQELEAHPDVLYRAGVRGIPTYGLMPSGPGGRGRLDLRCLGVPADQIMSVIAFYRDNPAARAAIEFAGNGWPEPPGVR